ncbi:hypothetical protein FRD01_22195 [Microvenator marinus]|uniref:SAF domain-containing protein n=1 Tax=Microvenator marinus TaxID=2600177 RepID=A0A5B8XWC7_9DELT|nr:SAF domain-containing protein [Microvenator marinus]QED29895.1 hypothetical protein FRD01_22195 [Microvenator marinus]
MILSSRRARFIQKLAVVWAVPIGLYIYVQNLGCGYQGHSGPTVRYVLTSQAVEAGTVLTQDLIQLKDVPPRFLPNDAVLADQLHNCFGSVFSESVEAGAVLLATDLEEGKCSR